MGGQKGEKVSRMIAEADEARTPDIVLGEISKKYQRENVDERKVRSRLETITTTTLVTPIGIELALNAGKAFLELSKKAKKEKRRSPSLFDAIILATARACASKVLTGDEHFHLTRIARIYA